MSDIGYRLRNWCIDWNGAPMVRGEPPRDGLHCDDLLDAADEIARLRAENERLQEQVRLFMGAAFPVAAEISPRGYNWSEAYLDQARANVVAEQSPRQEDLNGRCRD